ncbi:MAG: efflux RND transporter periplasmic adaptor subunit [Chloroflexi bacterium]|nr:efflux RND transporter periplasmic adaptor subunit [Chloroflexota bacterium]
MKDHVSFSILFVLLLAIITNTACSSAPSSRAASTFATPTSENANGNASNLTTARGSTLVKVTLGPIAQTIKARGRVASAKEAFLYFPLKGVVNKVFVASGDQVTQGTPIAQLDPFQLEQEVSQAKFDLDKADLQQKQTQVKLSVLDFRLEVATNVYSRTLQVRNALFQDYQLAAPAGLTDNTARERFVRFQTADQDFLKAATDLNTLKADKQLAALDIEATKQALERAQKVFEQTQTRLNGSKITAPFSGLIISIDKNVGEEIQAFDPIGAIADPAQLQVEASVTESDAITVGLGQPTSIVLDGFPDRKFSGKVKEISAKVSIFQGRNVLRVLVAFDEVAKVPATLRQGADVYLITALKNDVLLVPTKAIRTEGDKKVLTVIRDGKPVGVQVLVGAASDSQTEILAGVSEGEQVQVPQ